MYLGIVYLRCRPGLSHGSGATGCGCLNWSFLDDRALCLLGGTQVTVIKLF